MSLSRPAEPWSCPIKPALLLRHSCRYPCTQFRRSALSGCVSIFISPSSTASSLQPPTSIPILTLYCHRLVDPDQNCIAESCLGAWVLLSGQTPPSGTTFQPDQSRSFSQNPYCTSHDSAASTRRGPSTCSPSHQGPADRAVKAAKMLPSLAGRTPRLGKRRPWSRNQAGKGGVNISLPHTRGGPRPESIVDGGTCERVSHCLHATQKVAPSTSFPFGCGLLLLATSYGHAAEIQPPPPSNRSGEGFARSANLPADKTQVMMMIDAERSQSVFGVGLGVYPWKATAQGEKACFAQSPDHQKVNASWISPPPNQSLRLARFSFQWLELSNSPTRHSPQGRRNLGTHFLEVTSWPC
jgi:hypothetical protein